WQASARFLAVPLVWPQTVGRGILSTPQHVGEGEACCRRSSSRTWTRS
ncbi:MAG: hypothetical protein AVDCRST_MAG12-3150, partial [uncultured Rubrobacteraceae bacterium]